MAKWTQLRLGWRGKGEKARQRSENDGRFHAFVSTVSLPDVISICVWNCSLYGIRVNAGSGPLVEDVLLLLLGQQKLRGNASIAGNQIMEGLRASGHQIRRADYIMNRHASLGNVVATGKRRRRRYRLTT